MVIDGDVEGFVTCAGIAVGAITSGADAGLEETAKLFNIKMKEIAWSSAFVTEDRRPGRIEGAEAVEAVALEDAGKGSFGDGKNHEDLSVGAALLAQGDDFGFELRRRLARLTKWYRRAILQALREAGGLSALEPFADGFVGDAEGASGGAQRASFREMRLD